MKTIINGGIIILMTALLCPQTIEAQGEITYMSDLGISSVGSNPIGSDSWFATGFFTGTNPGGYMLNSVQLPMTAATGNPSGFTVMIYTTGSGGEVYISPGTI